MKIIDELEDDLRHEFDFSKIKGGVKEKFVDRFQAGANIVLLDSDVFQAFPTSESVNKALRLLMEIAESKQS